MVLRYHGVMLEGLTRNAAGKIIDVQFVPRKPIRARGQTVMYKDGETLHYGWSIEELPLREIHQSTGPNSGAVRLAGKATIIKHLNEEETQMPVRLEKLKRELAAYGYKF